ncbi:MAG: ABC transporter permease [Pirellulaceae bacterium]|nr:ABC transporter permease [Pirellulaceae bacterium]
MSENTEKVSGGRNLRIAILGRLFAPLLVLVLLVIVWQVAIIFFKIHPIILPTPLAVFQSFWTERSILAKAAFITGAAALCGLVTSVVLGAMIAVLFSQSAKLRAAFYPYVIFLQTVPIVAIAPLLIIWSGNNFRTIVLVSVIISIFPIVSNTTAGLLSINENLRDLFRVNDATRWQTLIKLRVPAAVSHLVLGTRISCGLAVIGAIVGEFFVGNSGAYDGLGTIMTQWQGRQYTSALIAAVLVSTLLGVLFFGSINLLSRTVLRRWTSAANLESE